MNACRRLRNELADSRMGFPSSEDRIRWKEHLAMCADCRRHWDEAEAIIRSAGDLQADARRAMAEVDWETLSERIADAALARPRTVAAAIPARPAPRSLAWRPVFAGALGGLLIGGAAMFFILRSRGVAPMPGPAVQASGEFINRVEMTLAKRDTLDYLAKSQALLLDFAQTPPDQAGRVLQGESALRRTRDLLSKKRLLNAHLDNGSIAKAREICDQIERLFVELSQISSELSAEEAARIQRFVEDKNLLLRIKLLQRELAESEV
jgi:hypothetical protein